MITKLRKKFIMINMLFVCSILLAVLTLLCTNSIRNYREGSLGLMRGILDDWKPMPRKVEKRPKAGKEMYQAYPACVVLLNQDESIREVLEWDLTMDQELAVQLSARVMAGEQEQGELSDYQLRYMVKTTKDGYKIAFVDTRTETAAIRILLWQCLVIFVIGAVAFLILSLYLSRWALRPVEQAWQQQTQFIADASHELKTPLTVILANLGILTAHKESTIAQQMKWLQNTKDEASRMKQLVEQLLFLARSDSGICPAVLTEVDVSSVVWSCLLPFEPLAFEQNLELDSDISPDLRILGNEGQLKQLIVILLDNACKYAGEKGRVSVKCHSQNDRVCLEVHNTGEPISKEERDHIFERFYRPDKSRARTQGGYGLGLAIAKTIVDQNQGKITVESNKETGTRFMIVFPKLQKEN